MSLSRREGRLLAVGLLALAAALAWLLLVRPVLAGFDAREAERQGLLFDYQRNERIIASARQQRAALRALRADAADWGYAAPGRELAADLLRERIVNAVRAERGQMGATETLDTAPGTVGVRAALTLPTGRLAALVAALENGRPWVAVDTLSVGAERAAAAGRAGPIDVRVAVVARFEPVRFEAVRGRGLEAVRAR